MSGAFVYLTRRTAANLITRKVAQVRNPRYAVAVVFGVAYLWWMLGRRSGSEGAPPGALGAHLELLATIGVGLMLIWTWAFARDRRALAFTPAEVSFLFTAPLPRRTLIHFKLLRAQGLILLHTLIWTVFLSAERFGIHGWMRGISVWLLLSTLQLHRLGAAFVRTSVAEHRSAGLRHRMLSLAVIACVLITLVVMAVRDLPGVLAARASGLRAFLDALSVAFARPLPSVVFAPLHAAIAPVVRHDVDGWLRALGPAIVVLVLHYVWVVRSDTAFEEAAAEASFARARALDARRRGAPEALTPGATQSAPAFRLAAAGPPATAIFWKNIIAIARRRRIRNLAIAFAVTAVALATLSYHPVGAVGETAGTLVATWAAISLVAGPQWVRNDLRTDLAQLELLRSYPIRGADLVAAEAAASTAVLTVAQLALTVLAYLAFVGAPIEEFSLRARTIGLAAAFALLPAINYIGLLLQNGAALLFPAWIRIGPGRTGGIEAVGQNLLTILVYAIALGMALLAPTLAGAALVGLLRPLVGAWGLIPGGVAMMAGIWLESRLLAHRLGTVFERIDIAESGIVRR